MDFVAGLHKRGTVFVRALLWKQTEKKKRGFCFSVVFLKNIPQKKEKSG